LSEEIFFTSFVKLVEWYTFIFSGQVIYTFTIFFSSILYV